MHCWNVIGVLITKIGAHEFVISAVIFSIAWDECGAETGCKDWINHLVGILFLSNINAS